MSVHDADLLPLGKCGKKENTNHFFPLIYLSRKFSHDAKLCRLATALVQVF